MPLRTITAPGVEIHEIDKSGYTPAMTGTAVYLKGFSPKGEAYKPMEFTTRSAFETVFGAPDTEAERYFYAGACEVLNQGGRLYAARLPYDNAAFEKLVGYKYKVNYSDPGRHLLSDAMFHEVSEQDSQIKQAAEITGAKSPILYDLSAIDEYRTKESNVPADTFLIVDTTAATYGRVQEDDRKGIKREVIGIVPVVTTAANAMYAQSYLSVSLSAVRNYEVISSDTLATLWPTSADGQLMNIDKTDLSNDGLKETDSTILFNTRTWFTFNTSVESSMLSIETALDMEGNVSAVSCSQYPNYVFTIPKNCITDNKISADGILDKAADGYQISSWVSEWLLSGEHLEQDERYFITFENALTCDPAIDGIVSVLNENSLSVLFDCEADAKAIGLKYAEHAARSKIDDIISPSCEYELSDYITLGISTTYEDVWKHFDEGFATSAERDEEVERLQQLTAEYRDVAAVENEDAGKTLYAVISADTVSCLGKLPEDDPRYGWHGKGFDDSVPQTLALNAAQFFTPIQPAADGEGGFEPDNLKDIGVVVFKAYLDVAEGNRVSFEPVEAYCGSLCKDDKDPNTGVTKFIDTIINSQSMYINFFSNCFNSTAAKEFYKKECDILLAPPSSAASLGLFTPMTKKDISISKSILDGMNKAFDKVSNILERDIDIVPDAGVSNIASYLKALFGDKGPYDLAITDALGNSMLGMWQCKKATDDPVKIWKTVILKHDNFCKNIRKDCMFIADGMRPLVLQGQKKIVRDTKPSNSIDKDILPFIPAICGINTNYGAGYANWFEQADDYTGDFFWCPPSIKATGVYINTDLNYEYWLAPAGLTRGIIPALDVSFNPNGKQAGCFYEKNWNYAINYPQDGIVLEGQKTFQVKPTALDRVNVRRTMLRLERAVFQVARYYVYENNTSYTRQRLVDAIEPIMRACWQSGNGGISRYKIVCDESNNTPDVIDRNELKVQIGVIPNKSAEFIVVDFILGNQSSTWEELF